MTRAASPWRWQSALPFAARACRRTAWALSSGLFWLVQRLTLGARRSEGLRPLPPRPRVLIFGWFGTETVGDRGILAECCRLLSDALDRPEYRIASVDRRRTEETVAIIGLNARVVAMSLREIGRADLVVVGGGPMMDDGTMFSWWAYLLAARWLRRPSALLGVGVHPLRASGTARASRAMAELATVVALREPPSSGGPRGPLVRIFADPSLYAALPARRTGPPSGGLRLAFNLRAWPIAFYSGSFKDYFRDWERFLEECLAALGETWGEGVVEHITFFPMHDAPGDDDRQIYPVIQARLQTMGVPASSLTFVTDLPTPQTALGLLADSHAFVGMRFHGNAFAALAGTPGLGLDYTTGGGKVSRLYEALGCPGQAVPLERATKNDISGFLREVKENWPQHHARVVSGRTRLRQTRPDLLAWLKELQGSA